MFRLAAVGRGRHPVNGGRRDLPDSPDGLRERLGFYWVGPSMRIRLTRKLAGFLNGVDVSRRRVGDVIDLPRRDAEILLAEGWALPVPDKYSGTGTDALVKDPVRRSKKKPSKLSGSRDTHHK
jgi:hypothetical protein